MWFLKKLFKISANRRKEPYPYSHVIHLWEDDSLMLELLPTENLEFIKAETKRINDFGREHFDGVGFTDITAINEKPFPTIDKLIDVSELQNILYGAGLQKITQFHVQDIGLVAGDDAPLGYGVNKIAVMCNRQENLVQDIWVTGQTANEEDRQKLATALLSIGQTFGFVAVNWYQGTYYNLIEDASVEDFLRESCS